MLIQPFIENTLRHGFQGIKYPGKIKIDVFDRKEWIEVKIEDNGTGFSRGQKNNTSHRSMAMKIFEKRRKLIQQKLKKDFRCEVINSTDNDPGKTGVTIKLKIPVLDYD
jgi:LytS/YehU family sensor histidine kinase